MQYRKYLSVSGLAVIAVSVLLFSCLAGLMLGYIPLSFPEVLGALAGCDGAAADIVRNLRLPRIILSAAAGMGLALSGVVMQAMFRNPMASPYIMGISSGASLGAVAAVFLGIGSAWGAGGVGLGAFAGALLRGRALGLPTYSVGLGKHLQILFNWVGRCPARSGQKRCFASAALVNALL